MPSVAKIWYSSLMRARIRLTPSNSAAAADGHRVTISLVLGATLSRAVAAAERQTVGRRKIMDWRWWMDVLAWTPLSTLPSTTPVTERIYKIDEMAFLVAQEYNAHLVEDGSGPYATILAWAPTAGALKRVLDLHVEADEGLGSPVPHEMLLPGSDGTYGSLLRLARTRSHGSYLEHAAYRIAGDGRFVCRTLDVGPFEFHFRERGGGKESAFCVCHRLRNVTAPSNSALQPTRTAPRVS